MKKLVYFICSLILFALGIIPALAYAQTTATKSGQTTVITNPINSTLVGPTKPVTKEGTNSSAASNNMENLRSRADQEITRRVKSLTALIARVNALKRLSTDQKAGLTTQIQAQIDSLNALKVKIDADTDMTTLKTDVKSIVDSYRIYALFMPQIGILTASDEILNTVDKFNVYVARFQTKINDLKAAGQDVTALQASLTDMQNQLKDATTQANNASSSALPLTPAGYPGNRSVLTSAKNNLLTARKDLQTARADGLSIYQGLKGSNTSTNSAQPLLLKPTTTISTTSAQH